MAGGCSPGLFLFSAVLASTSYVAGLCSIGGSFPASNWQNACRRFLRPPVGRSASGFSIPYNVGAKWAANSPGRRRPVRGRCLALTFANGLTRIGIISRLVEYGKVPKRLGEVVTIPRRAGQGHEVLLLSFRP